MKRLLFFAVLAFIGLSTNAQWISLDGPSKEFVNCIAVKEDTIFAGTPSDGVFLSTDNAFSWTAINNGLGRVKVVLLSICGKDIFAETENGIYVSSNNGNSWHSANDGLYMDSLNTLGFVLKGDTVFTCAFNYGVYYSTNHGNSWNLAANIGFPTGTAYEFAVSGNNMVAGTAYGVYLSTDDGNNWSVAGMVDTTIYALGIRGDTIIATNSGKGTYISPNKGTSWQKINRGLTDSLCVNTFFFKGNRIFATTCNHGVFLSSNHGNNWHEVNSGISDTTVWEIDTNANYLFAVSYKIGAVYKSANNGNSWSAINDVGNGNTTVNSLVIKGDTLFAGTENIGVRFSKNCGKGWHAANTGLTDTIINALAVSGNNIFAGTYNHGVFLSSDDGRNWSPKNTGIFGGFANITSFAIKGNNIYAGSDGDGCYWSVNNGNNWTSVGMAGHHVSSLAIEGDTIFAGTDINGVLLSLNNGGVWNSHGIININVLTLAMSGNDIFAGSNGQGVFVSSDTDVDWDVIWNIVDTGLTNKIVNTIVVSGNTIYAGTNGGVFMSSNNGLLWTAINSGLTDTLVTALVINNDTIYAGTNGGGVWKQAISDIIVGVKEINNNAGDIVVYPNPANNIITIENSSFIKGQTISVCDVRGQLLLQQPMQKAKTNINITTFSKGLYFIKVQNERGIAVRKFVKE